jgi:hypothetical protein
MSAKIAAAFIKAKREFAPALKTHTNPAFRSKYADLAACLEAVNDALLNNSIAVYQETFEDTSGVTVETVFLHESGETIRGGKLHVPASKQDPQGYGSALSYARRYSLMAACGIAAEDDDGNAASKQAPKVEAKPKPVTESEVQAALSTFEEITSLVALQSIFGALYKRADEKQQQTLKAAYDRRKAELTTKEPA